MSAKAIIPAIALLGAIASNAATLTPDEALARVMKESDAMRASARAVVAQPRLIHTTVGDDGEPAVYIFAADSREGSIVVSADDVAAPLLGYCDTPADGELPPELRWWLGQYAAEIEAARSEGAPRYIEPAAPKATTARKAIAPLVKTRWDQGAPYNNDCPSVSQSVIGNGKAPTGCVATAMAQVMKYFGWPAKGTGTGSATVSGGSQQSMNFNVTFDWANMTDTYAAGSYTATQASAVALLMKACGYSVAMNYTPSASGAQSTAIPGALINNFGYDSGAALYRRDYYGREEWEEMIYNNLANVGPVIYTGASNVGGGHAFVCDGYSADGYFHFNWGWSGMYDGYYLLTALNPEGQGVGGFAGGYNISQDVVLGICRPTGQAVKHPFRLTSIEAVTGEIDGIYLSMAGGWFNFTGATQSFEIGARFERVGATGANAVQYVSLGNQSLDVNAGWGGVNVPLTYASLTDGNYKVSLVTREKGADWLGALHAASVPDYLILTMSGNGYSVKNVSESHLTITNVKLYTDLYSGRAAKMSFRVTNESDVEIAGAVAPIMLSGNTPVAEGECVFVDLLPGESSDEELIFTLQTAKGFSVNTQYNFCLYNPCDNYVYGSLGNMAVKSAPADASLRCTSFTLAGANPVTDKANMRFTANVECRSGYLTAPLMLVIFRETSTGYVNEVQKSFEDYLFLSSGQSASTTAVLDFSQGAVGENYMAAVYNPSDTSNPLDMLEFTLSTQSGVEAVGDDSQLSVAYSRAVASAVVVSGAEITRVSVSGVDGRTIPAAVTYNGTTAVVDLSQAPSGVAVISASDATGAVKVAKVVL